MSEGDWSYPRVEGLLRGLGQLPQARPAQSMRTGAPTQGHRGLDEVDRSESRLDVAMSLERLEPEHAAVLRDHYILGVRRRGSTERRQAIRRLKTLLEGS